MDEATELLRLAAQGLVAAMAGGPAAEARLTPHGGYLLSGAPLADLNMMVVWPSSGTSGFVAEAGEQLVALGLPAIAMVSPAAEAEAAAPLTSAGFTAAGAFPLMALAAGAPVAPSRACDVRAAIEPGLARSAVDLVAAAFGLDRAVLAETLEPCLVAASAARTFVVMDGATPRSSVLATPAGDTVGIWNMATPPEGQGRGWGKALLTTVIDHYRRQGAGRFYLMATVAGFPLYRAIGFTTVAEISVWARGDSVQVHG